MEGEEWRGGRCGGRVRHFRSATAVELAAFLDHWVAVIARL